MSIANNVLFVALATCSCHVSGSSVPATGLGAHIEGASVGPAGKVYATNFRNSQDSSFDGNNMGRNMIGSIDVDTGKTSMYFTGEASAVFNGMKWDVANNVLFLADVGQGKVVQVNTSTMAGKDYCGGTPDLKMTGVPNDFALSKAGLLFLSGQDWASSKGALWLCVPNAAGGATAMELEGGMGRTNGIALSPDDRTLYLSEARGSPVPSSTDLEGQRIWKYTVAKDGSVSAKTEFYNFASHPTPEADIDSDGMLTDAMGNLYITRNGKGKVTVLSPAGNLMQELSLSTITYATNLAFGGSDGKTLYVVGRCGMASWGTGDGCIEAVVAANPGREWTLIQDYLKYGDGGEDGALLSGQVEHEYRSGFLIAMLSLSCAHLI